ncbi:MAG: DUF2927 domain-containing protein [Pseudomonadota bacterium]
MLLIGGALTACLPHGASEAPSTGPVARPSEPEWRTAVPWGTDAYDHASLAHLFRRLALGFEDGGERPGLIRLSAPIALEISGPGAPAYRGFIDAYAAWLSTETGIAISGPSGAPAQGGSTLHLHLVETAEPAIPPGARCIHLPGEIAWSRYREAPRRALARARRARGKIAAATVLIPASLPPAAIRSCLLEEIPQAMGLSNDLPDLGPTIFNDDGAHLWPTKLDLLILTLLYAPEIEPGMAAAASEAAARKALARLRPETAATRRQPPAPQPDAPPRASLQGLVEAEATLAAGNPADAFTASTALLVPLAGIGHEAAVARLHRLRSAALRAMGRGESEAGRGAALAAQTWTLYALGTAP